MSKVVESVMEGTAESFACEKCLIIFEFQKKTEKRRTLRTQKEDSQLLGIYESWNEVGRPEK